MSFDEAMNENTETVNEGTIRMSASQVVCRCKGQ